MTNDIAIKININPVVTLFCRNNECRFNNIRDSRISEFTCGLKTVYINKNGQCAEFEQITEEEIKAYCKRLEGES